MNRLTKDVSIVIPTYNRVEMLEKVISSYCIQDNVLEILIVDDGSNSSYNQLLNFCKEEFPSVDVKLIRHEHNKGMSAARNTGIRNANGKFILMGEDDVVFNKDYVSTLRNKIIKYEKNGTNIFVAGLIFYDVDGTSKQVKEQIQNRLKVNNEKKLFDYDRFSGCFGKNIENDLELPFCHALIMIEKKAYDQVLYNEEFKGNEFREESDCQLRLQKIGYKAILTPDAECYHMPASLSRKPMKLGKWISTKVFYVVNNWKFWNRNYSFIKNNFTCNHVKIWYQLSYIPIVFNESLYGIKDRFKRTVLKRKGK